MAKKTKKGIIPASTPLSERLTSPGKAWIAAGGLLLILGFFLLARADALGRGVAAHACPFLILGGYALIGVGLWRRPHSPP